jgi:putative aldouronate transport system permease protein
MDNNTSGVFQLKWYSEYVRRKDLLLMLLPPMVFFAVFNYVPMAGIVIAFKDFSISSGIVGSPWCGLQNFRDLFINDQFMLSLKNTLVISILKLFFGFLAPILLALLLNELRINWFKRTIQTVTYLPYFFSWVVLGGIFIMLFSTGGPVNTIAKHVYGEPIAFMTNSYWFLFIIVATAVWQTVGYGAIIYLAALSGISPTLYEAAVVDGADRWQQTVHITIPSLMPTIITMFILSLGGILNAGFDQIFNMYNPMVYGVSDILDTYALTLLQDMNYSLGTAVGLFKSFVGMFLIVFSNFLVRKISKDEHGIW